MGNKLIDDDFFNGDPFPVALWRIPQADWAKIRLKVLPYSDGLNGRLPEEARKRVETEKARSSLDQISISADEIINLAVSSGKS